MKTPTKIPIPKQSDLGLINGMRKKWGIPPMSWEEFKLFHYMRYKEEVTDAKL